MQTILKTLPALLDQSDEPEMRRAVVFAMWQSVVGGQLKEHSQPTNLNERILSIAVPDAEWKREFEHHAAQIVYRLNAAAGRSVVARINCVVDADAVKRSGKNPLTNPSATRYEAVDQQIVMAATRIHDTALRNNFIGAAANCLNRKPI